MRNIYRETLKIRYLSKLSKEQERERETVFENVDRRIAIVVLYVFQHSFKTPRKHIKLWIYDKKSKD